MTQRASFSGFEPLTANFLYCPNQFLDVCIPNCSRGTVRLVAYLLRRTLGWLDEEGKPVEQEIAVSYRDLIQDAGISRGSLGKAVEEAVATGFIVCMQQGNAKAKGVTSQQSRYALRWDARGTYAKSLEEIDGFFQGNGNRTPIPNAFFDTVIPKETHAVVKVVGAVLRHTVGYENQFGTGRRQQAALSYSYIQKFGNIKNRGSLSDALKRSIEAGYIQCVDKGCFHVDAAEQSSATYAVRWLVEGEKPDISSKSVPGSVRKTYQEVGPENVPGDQFGKRTRVGSENVPGDRFGKRTSKKTNQKNTLKEQQQEQNDVPSVVVTSQAKDLLIQAGFPEKTAARLAHLQPLDVIRQQIEWIEHRNPQDNKLGMLRRAIEENWSEPTEKSRQRSNEEARRHERAQDAERIAEEQALKKTREDEKRIQAERLKKWSALTKDERSRRFDDALERIPSRTSRAYLLRNRNLDNPGTQVLALMTADLELPRGESS